MPLNDQSCPALNRGVRLQKDRKTGEPLLLFPEGVLYLSETAAQIVQHCDGSTAVKNIIQRLASEYDAEAEALSRDVLECLADLHQRKLVVV
jgi:pyrroloquinoline quinone biosynthesis protein D